MTRGTRAAAVAIAAGLLVSSASAVPAVADPGTDGFWYFDVFNIQKAHDAGITGEGVTIAVIDSQINLEVPTLQGADIEVQPSLCWDDNGAPISPTSEDVRVAAHGTNVVSYLVGSGDGYPGQTGLKGIVPDAKILFFSAGQEISDTEVVCNTESGESRTAIEKPAGADAIFRAAEAGVDIISISMGGSYTDYMMQAVAYAMNRGVVVVASVRNEGLTDEGFDLFTGFPAGLNGVVGVQSADSNALPQENHVDPDTMVMGPGVQVVWQGDSTWEEQRYARGTSIATPIVAGFIALVAQKYPDATGNQLIQTLIRNTGVEDHELYYDPTGSIGYGSASATHMLRVDPTQYDDVNPLLVDDGVSVPTPDNVKNPVDREFWDPNFSPADEDPADPDQPSTTGVDLLPMLAIGGALLLVAIIITIVIVLAIRRSRATTNPPRA